MTKIKVLYGEQRCKEYEQTGDLDKVKSTYGDLEELEFNTEEEFEAFKLGLNRGNFWDEFWIVEKDGKKLED